MLWELLALAEQNSARIVFCGDTKQIQSVEACDTLRVLEKESRLKSVALTEVQRQKGEDYREAIQELRTNLEHGFEKLDTIAARREVAWLDRARAVAAAYADSESEGASVLVVCATHDEIDRVTGAIRSARRQAGELGTSVQVQRDVSLNWTTAQKTDMASFRHGQFLGFHREVKGIAKNETVEIVRVGGKRVIVRNERGAERAVTAKHAKAFDVFERQALEVAPSDKLLLTANRREPGFRATNGEIVIVSHVDEKGRVHLEDGRILPSDFKQFAHGYAVTAHRSQGKSVDSVIIEGGVRESESSLHHASFFEAFLRECSQGSEAGYRGDFAIPWPRQSDRHSEHLSPLERRSSAWPGAGSPSSAALNRKVAKSVKS